MKQVFILGIVLMVSASFTIQKKKKVIFFGDSITQAGVQPGGYIVEMQELLQSSGRADQFELIGAGIGGNKVYDLFLRMEEDVLSKNPDIVIIWVGVNDVWHKRSHGTGTDPDKFVRFYQAMIKKLKARNIEVMLCTPAAIGEKTDYSNELDGDLNRYAGFIRDLAREHSLTLIDLRKRFLDYNLQFNKDNREAGILTTDRVHLNAAGNKLVAENMLAALTGDKNL